MFKGDKYPVIINISIVLFFLVTLITGLSVYDDYGISWDELEQRDYIGIVNYNVIFSHNFSELRNSIDRYHGPAFEIFLIALEKIFHPASSRDIYLMRHLATFILFFIALIFFFLSLNKIFRHKLYSLAGCLFLLLSPRIFADAFYNSKDLPFLSFMIISFYTSISLHQKPTLLKALAHGIVTGILIDIRILGILMPVADTVIFVSGFLFSGSNSKKIIAATFLTFYVVLIAVTILCWPVLWEEPIYHFRQAFVQMRQYPWESTVQYMGKSIIAYKLPWHYIPTWILISTPLFYIILFFTGCFSMVKQFFSHPKHFIISNSELLQATYFFFIPVLSIILLKSIVYDGWRHLYFVYPFFIIIAVYGLKQTAEMLQEKMNYILFTLVIIAISNATYAMIQMHPFQNVFFNALVNNQKQDMKKYFEVDYWGLSYRKGLEFILAKDTSLILVYSDNGSALKSSIILPSNDRGRLRFVSKPHEADYFITTFRWDKIDYSNYQKCYEIKEGGVTVLATYKVENHLPFKTNIQAGEPFIVMKNDFEKNYVNWNNEQVKVVDTTSFSGRRANIVDSLQETSAALLIRNDSCLLQLRDQKIEADFVSPNLQNNDNALIMVLIRGKAGVIKAKFTGAINQVNDGPNGWKHWNGEIKLPADIDHDDALEILIWSSDKKTFIIDDLTFSFYRIS